MEDALHVILVYLILLAKARENALKLLEIIAAGRAKKKRDSGAAL